MRLIGSETMRVCGRHYRRFQKSIVIMYCRKHICHKYKNCRLSSAVLPGANKSLPVSVPRLQLLCFSGTVNAAKRLFVQQNTEIMTAGDLGHQTHQQQIVIIGQIGFLKNRSQFKLVGSDLVMTGFAGIPNL